MFIFGIFASKAMNAPAEIASPIPTVATGSFTTLEGTIIRS
jgi:hypothetical protein